MAQVTLNPDTDTFIWEGNQTQSYGDAAILSVAVSYEAKPDEAWIYRTLLHFDLSAYAGATIANTSKLRLWVHVIWLEPYLAYIRRISQPAWTGDATWLKYDGVNNWASAGGDKTDDPVRVDVAAPVGAGWLETTGNQLMVLIQDALDERSNQLDMMLTLRDESTPIGEPGSGWHFHSNEASDVYDPANEPELVLDYTPAAVSRRIFIC